MREFWRTMTGPKQGVYSVRRTRSAHRNASTGPCSPSDSNPSGSRGRCSPGGLHFGRLSRRRLASLGAWRPAALRQVVAVDFARALRGLPSYRARNALGCLPAIPGRFKRGGLIRENNV